MISHLDFDLNFPDDLLCWVSFHIPIGHSKAAFRKKVLFNFLIGLLIIYWFGFYSVVYVLYIFWVFIISCVIGIYFLLSYKWPLHFAFPLLHRSFLFLCGPTCLFLLLCYCFDERPKQKLAKPVSGSLRDTYLLGVSWFQSFMVTFKVFNSFYLIFV